MRLRSWISILMLINYLLVVGAGCMSRPEDQQKFVMVQTTEEGSFYQDCRYLRMDGLESFLADALASRYQSAPETPRHHVISVVLGIDTHYLTYADWSFFSSASHWVATPPIAYLSLIPAGVYRSVNAPPWRQ